MNYPLTIVFPAGAQIAVPQTWQRLPTGEIEAVYNDHQELYWSITLSQWLREWSLKDQAGPLHQGELIPRGKAGAAYEL